MGGRGASSGAGKRTNSVFNDSLNKILKMQEGTEIRVTYENGITNYFRIGNERGNPKRFGLTDRYGDMLFIPATNKQGVKKFFVDNDETSRTKIKIKSIDVELPSTKAQEKARRNM